MITTITCPFEQASAVYESEECVRTFEEDLVHHFHHGYVFSTPESFIMGRPVDRYREDLALDPSYEFPREEQNAWLIWLAAGDMREFFLRKPYPLKWVGWERENVLRWYPMDKIEEKLLCIR